VWSFVKDRVEKKLEKITSKEELWEVTKAAFLSGDCCDLV
jgi:hypothetical protein